MVMEVRPMEGAWQVIEVPQENRRMDQMHKCTLLHVNAP